jgi:membrane associated rhomboid family serine protease
MILPIRHHNMTARRWPVVTIAIIVLNLAAFLATNSTIQEQDQKLSEVKLHLLLLAAAHPELQTPPETQSLVGTVREHNPKLWARMQSPSRDVEDSWDARMRLMEDPELLQPEMDALSRQYSEQAAASITEHYAFIPAHPASIAYLTANFLHGGWLHLIGNMWFLWLAGFVLEDAWGRIIYAIFYLAAGAAALQFWGWLNPGNITPTLGASGAVAALMGAFLIRFPKMKIHIMVLLLYRPRFFDVPAYALLPLWLLKEVFFGSMGGDGNVANWAHVGGFLFGVLGALTLRYSGLERRADAAIEAKINPEDPAVQEAKALLQANQPDEALARLRDYVAVQPEAADAWTLLQEIYWGKGDFPAYREATLKLCEMYVRARELEPASLYAKDYLKAGGEKLPAATWLELGRLLEDGQEFPRAAAEYEKLAAGYPDQRESLLAQLGAAKVCLKRLNRPADALKFFQQAAASPVPHLDWESNIVLGIREAEAALAMPQPLAPQAAG